MRSRWLQPRYLPLAAFGLVLLLSAAALFDHSEESLWDACLALYDSGDPNGVSAFENYRRIYPEGAHLEDAAYFQAQLAQRSFGCRRSRDPWKETLNGSDPLRRTEAARRLGDCAAAEGNLMAALEYYRRAQSDSVMDEHAAAAAYGAGVVSDELGYSKDAVRYLRSLWDMPSTNAQRIQASRRLQKRTLHFARHFARENVLRNESYVVQRGDNLLGISRRFGVALNRLIWANPSVQPNLIKVGQTLSIPIEGSSLSALLIVSDRTLYLTQRGLLLCPFPIAPASAESIPAGEYRASRVETGTGLIELSNGAAIRGGASESELLDPALKSGVRLADADMESLLMYISPGSRVMVVEDGAEKMRWIDVSTGDLN